MTEYFKAEAKKWDSKDRTDMAAAIWKCMADNMPFNKDMKAADIGTGTGLIAFELAKKVSRVTAVDSTVEMLEVLKGKISRDKISNIEVLAADIDKDGLPLSGLGAIICSMALHHMKDTQGFLAKAYQALSLGGIIGIADLDKEDGGFHADPAAAGALHFGFERGRFEQDMKNAGFKDIRFHTAYKTQRENGEYPVFLATGKK